MSIFEHILRKSAIYTVALVAGKVASIVLLPLYTRYLTTADYGVLDLLSSAQMFFELLVGVRLADGLLYYHAKAQHEEPGVEKAVVSSALHGALIFGAMTAMMGIVWAKAASRMIFQTEAHAELIRIVCFGISLLPLAEVGLGYLRALDNALHYTVVSTMRLVATGVLVAVFLVVYGMGVKGVLWAATIGTAVQAIWVGLAAAWKCGLRFSPHWLWVQLKYAAPLCLSGLLMTFIHYGDRFFLQRHVSMADIGLYGLAYKVGMLVSLVSTPFFQYWHSQMFHVLRQEDGGRVYVRLLTYLAFVLQASALAVTVFARPVLAVLAAPPFLAAAELVPYVAATYVIRGVGDQLRCVFSARRRTDLLPVVTGAGVVVCGVLYALMIPRWGVYGALAATAAGFSVMAAASYVLGQRLQVFRFEWGRMSVLTGASVGVAALFLLLAPLGFWPRLGAAALTLAGWFTVLIAAGFFTEGEREWFHRKLRALRAAG